MTAVATPGRSGARQPFPQRLIARLFRPALLGIETRIHSLERRLEHELERTKLGVWRGGLDGILTLPDGGDNLVLSTRLRQELAFWRRAVKVPGGHPAITGEFETAYGSWQRARLEEIRGVLGVASGAEFLAWSRDRVGVELGGGPYPLLAAGEWRWSVSVDPLADGYASEGLVVGAATRVAMLAACAEAVPLPSRCADLVVCENCLDHVIDPARVLAEVRRLLSPRGCFWLRVDLSETSDDLHPHPMSVDRVRGLLGEQKLEVVHEASSAHASHPRARGEMRVLARPA